VITEAAVKERPILFSGPMVRAILAKSKTQTRRVVKLPDSITTVRDQFVDFTKGGFWRFSASAQQSFDRKIPGGSFSGSVASCVSEELDCPHGKPGDKLWVRETFQVRYYETLKSAVIWYAADGEVKTVPEMTSHCAAEDVDNYVRKYLNRAPRPSIFMPLWASRISLEITKVRVERLHSLTFEDAKAEGVEVSEPRMMSLFGADKEQRKKIYNIHGELAFRPLWDSINEKRGFGWVANPWVWVIEFKRVKP
jgi:hypothetical protein